MKTYRQRPAHKQVKILEGFWKEQLDKIHHVTVWDVLNKFEHDHEEGIMKNYEWVAEGKTGQHIGPPWYDGLICEVIRGISDIIAVTYDEELDAKIEYYTEKIAKAQAVDEDGYINTYTTLMCPDKRFGENGGSLIWQHELYNIGCLVEAGVHYYLAVGKTELLKSAILAADCLCKVIGPEPRKNIVPAHSLGEEAMIKLYKLLETEPELCTKLQENYGIHIKPEKYLALAKFWMDHRGVHHNRASFPHYMGEYAQDHCKIEEQSEAVGHAVRAALMYTGLTALGIETDEAKYLEAAKRIWDNVEQTKLHISGGIGAIHNEERFGFQYDLPNNAYLETCAGVAMAFWAGEMYRAFGESRYIDVFECSLYNNVLPGLSADGTHYFYENPLISDGSLERWDWHGCPCCPPMFLKLMGSLQDYIYAYSEESIAINMHMGSTATFGLKNQNITVTQKDCALPWEGKNNIEISLERDEKFAIEIRVPAWADQCKAVVNGEEYTEKSLSGYLIINRVWKSEDIIHITMELPTVKIEAHPYVTADIGKVALQRGPFLYCLEEIDNPQGTDVILDKGELNTERMNVAGTVIAIKGKCHNQESFTAVPYYSWNNRDKGTMQVWLKQEGKDNNSFETKDNAKIYAAHCSGTTGMDADMKQWAGKLYRRFIEANH